MFFSIIIPTCNRTDLLGKCLSKLNHDVQCLDASNYEVIVTDDGASDNTKSFIEKNYRWVKWIRGPQRGPAANRNNGASFAKGDWLIFLDDDCEPVDGLVSIYKEQVIAYPNIQVFEGAIHAIRSSKSPLEYGPFNTTGGFLWSCNFCISVKLFNSLKGFDETFIYPHLEDNDLKRRIDQNDQTIIFISNAIVYHPWKKITSGLRLGKFEEMTIYYYEKHGIKYSLVSMILSICKVYLGFIKRNPFSFDLLKVLLSLGVHISTLVFYYKAWKKEYSN